MKDRRLAVRYARALIAALPDTARAQAADSFLTAVAGAMETSPEFRDVLLDPAHPRSQRRAVLEALARDKQMPDEMINFLGALVEHNRTPNLPSIAQVFHEELESKMGIVPAEITTATPMSDELRQRAQQALQTMTGKQVRLTYQVDSELIGGAVTRIGSTVFDGSVRTQLDQLRRQIAED